MQIPFHTEQRGEPKMKRNHLKQLLSLLLALALCIELLPDELV